MTVFGSHGRARTDDFGPGDVGYVPQGYGHYIENTGDSDLEIVLAFNNGTYQSVSITAWMASTPDLPARHQLQGAAKHLCRLPQGRRSHARLTRDGGPLAGASGLQSRC